MKKMIFLLVSAVALLFCPAQPRPTTENSTLNAIIDHAHKYNKSLHKDLLVEDISDLANAECNNKDENANVNKFLCKVHDILEKHENFTKRMDEQKIVRNLKNYINGTKENCAELLKDVPASGRETEIPKLLNSLVKCIQEINLNRVIKSNA